ncbi:MAG: pantoate--beta-alanine ligase [Caulobacteraceae bacterium]
MPTPPATLRTVRTIAQLRRAVADWHDAGLKVALVPTMGALHRGHLALVARGRRAADRVVVSLFVNPAQFGPGEDFTRYPCDEAGDRTKLLEAGADLLYAPAVGEIYPAGFATSVMVAGLSERLEGAHRPGHFTGVATIVAKLLLQTGPDVACFGEKDYQQLQVIRRLALDLDLPVEIVGAPIMRDADGLALSSRNAYLTPAERRIAPALRRALQDAADALAGGADVAGAEADAREAIATAGFAKVDYVEARGPCDLERLGPGPLTGPARILAAARIGRTRLIDNIAVTRPQARAGA